jgi:hypothetical protein
VPFDLLFDAGFVHYLGCSEGVAEEIVGADEGGEVVTPLDLASASKKFFRVAGAPEAEGDIGRHFESLFRHLTTCQNILKFPWKCYQWCYESALNSDLKLHNLLILIMERVMRIELTLQV